MAAGRIASLMGVEGGHSLDGSLASLRLLAALGVRYLTLTHTCNNEIGDSCQNECTNDIDCRGPQGRCQFGGKGLYPGEGSCSSTSDGGLTSFGKRVLGELGREGVLPDLSHVAASTMRGVLASLRPEAPLIFSHSSAAALCGHPRNVPTDVLEALRTRQGPSLVMATFVPNFLTCDRFNATLMHAADHIDFLARGFCPDWAPDDCNRSFVGLGVDRVGVGSDFDGNDLFPIGLEHPGKMQYLFAELSRRGYSQPDLLKIGSGNAIRILETAEAFSRKLKATTQTDETVIFPQRPPCRISSFP